LRPSGSCSSACAVGLVPLRSKGFLFAVRRAGGEQANGAFRRYSAAAASIFCVTFFFVSR